MASKTDVRVFEGLSIVKVRGFKPTEPEAHERGPVDLPGDANWFCESYGMASEPSEGGPGILWADYDAPAWDFAVLIDSDEVDGLRDHAEGAGYEILATEEVTEPTNFGDGGGTVEILKHRDGWVVLA